MSTADEIIVKLTAQTDQLKAGMAEGAAIVKATQDEMAASMQASMNAFREFDAIQKGSITTAAQLASAQEAVTAAQASGAFTSEELAAKQAILAAAMAKLPKEAAAASSGLAAALTRNSRTAYSASAFISDALTGQFSRSRREMAALANETGIMAKALQFALSPAGLFAEALLAIGVGVIAADDHYEKFEQTILRTGDIIGMSAGELQGMANDVGLVTGHTFEAVDAVQALGASGRFTGDQLRLASEAAVSFSEVTGEKVGQAAKIIESLAEKPKTAIAEVNDQFHFLTQSQADLIEKLLATGQNAQAAAVAVQAFHDAMMDRAGEMEAHTSALSRGWHSVSNWIQQAAENEAEYIEVSTGGGDATEKLAVAQRQLATDERIAAHWWSDRFGLMTGVSTAQIEQEKQVVAQLEAEKHAADSVAQAKAKAAQATAEQFDKATHARHGRIGGSGQDDERAFQQAQYAAQQQGHELSLAEQKAWWQKRLAADQAGGAADANATAAAMRHVVELQKQMERQLEESGKKVAEEAKRQHEKDAQSALRSLEEKRDATLAFSRERMRLDAEIVAAAVKWYGKDSSAYRQAERQKLADTQADAKETERAHKQAAATDAETAREIADARIANAKQQAQTEFDQGKISAAQLLQIHNDLAHQKLAADVAYFKAKQALDAGDVNAEKRDAAQIVVAHLKASQQMSADLDKSLKDGERRWKQYSQRIAGEMQNAVNAMLFQHQTLRNSLASVGESIAETFIESVVDRPLQAFIAGEGEKLAAAIGFGASKTSAEAVQHAASTATDVADKTAAVVRASGVAGAQGIASFAAAPWPIDLGAPAFGASMAAAALGYLSMVSAAGGWERVPADGMLTQLHKDEMVLPAHIANPMRDMVRGGGAGGGTHHYHYTINAYDRRGLADFVARNGIELGKGLQRLGRNGHTL